MAPEIKTFGLKEEELTEIVEYFEVYRMEYLPEGIEAEDMPVRVETFASLLEDMGFSFTEAELWDIIEKLDPNRLGYILLATFLEKVAKELMDRSKITEKNSKEIFDLMDRNHDLLVNIEDLRIILKLFGENVPLSYIKEMMKEVDLDGDDQMSYDEFLFFTTGISE